MTITLTVIASLTRYPCGAGLGQWNMPHGSQIKYGMTDGVGMKADSWSWGAAN